MSFVEQQIRKAMENGDFDDLPGKGKPLDLSDGGADMVWWLKNKMVEEGLSMPLPPELQMKKDVQNGIIDAMALGSEDEVRLAVAALNVKIRKHNRSNAGSVPIVDPAIVLGRWRVR